MAVKIWNGSKYDLEYIGLTLADREANYYDDSDFYAVVWDTEHQTMRSIEYGSTRYPSPTTCVIDATDDIRKLANEDAYKRIKRSLERSKNIYVGRDVKVIKGRNVPIGTVGIVRSINETRNYTQLYIETVGGDRYKTYTANVEAVPYEESYIEDRARAISESVYKNNDWHVFFSPCGIMM